MAAIRCVWYVSGFRRPWEAAVIGSLAAALKTLKPESCSLQIYTEGGTANLRFGGALSWNSLTFFERMRIVLFGGRLWHLWGDAPSWWGWVRLRARTIHTSLSPAPNWKGHPTRLFAEQAGEGESRITPTFDVKAAWTDENNAGGAHALLLATRPSDALREALLESKIETVPLEAAEMDTSLKRGGAVLVDNSPSNVLLAAYLTMRGVPVLVDSGASLLKTLLGPGGYISPQNAAGEATVTDQTASKAAWKEALSKALSEAGRTTSAGARHFLKENYSLSDSAESLERLYRATTA